MTSKIDVLNFVKTYHHANQRPPSAGEIAAHFGTARKTARLHLVRLAHSGLLHYKPRVARGYRIPNTGASTIVPEADWDEGQRGWGRMGHAFTVPLTLLRGNPAVIATRAPYDIEELRIKARDILLVATPSQATRGRLVVFLKKERRKVICDVGPNDAPPKGEILGEVLWLIRHVERTPPPGGPTIHMR
jgi:hypothetical protein